ncbi:MAG: hypothetical protein MJ213_03600 [Bacilli bacterium]|nr:hypothetical protein [Bacilli bacterium]
MDQVEKHNDKTPILLLFLGTIFSAVGALSSINVNGFQFFGILALVGLILELIGIGSLKKHYENFNKAFTGIIMTIIITVVMLIISIILASVLANTDGNKVVMVILQIVVLAGSIALLIIGIRINASIIKGCYDVVKTDDIQSFGVTTLKWYKISVYIGIATAVISIVLSIVASFATNAAGPLGTVILVFSIISGIVSIAAQVLIIVLVGKTNAALK